MLRTGTYLLGLLAAGSVVAGCSGDGVGSAAGVPSDGETGNELRVETEGWKTDFSKHSVPLGEFVSGGPPRNGIPPIDEPKFVSAERAAEFLTPREPVMVVEVDGRARGYPLQILVWHEIVNDVFAGRAIAVTYCPLCNSSLVFDRTVDGRTLRLGTTGNLRNSDLVMWDDATESWWQQITGTAVVGELTGTRLTPIASQTLSFADFGERFPDGEVLSRDTGFQRDYGRNPYAGYEDPDRRDDQPFLLVVHADAARRPVVFFSKRGVVSALDAEAISLSDDVGTAATFDRRLDGRMLTFEPRRP